MTAVFRCLEHEISLLLKWKAAYPKIFPSLSGFFYVAYKRQGGEDMVGEASQLGLDSLKTIAE